MYLSVKDSRGLERSGPPAGQGNPAGGSSRDDGGVRKSPSGAGLVAVDPGVVLLDLGLRDKERLHFFMVLGISFPRKPKPR